MAKPAPSEETRPPGERVAKVIARSGLCSRREAEALVAQGRVEIDGETLTSPAVNLRPGQRLTVDGEALPALEPVRLFRYHKPRGVLVAASDPQGRPTIYDRLPAGLPRLMPVGRLDYNSEGLLLLTNDGGLKRRLELPATGWRRRYRVRVHGRPSTEDLEGLAKGVRVGEVAYGPIDARLDEQRGANAWLTFGLREGKNREIRRICEHLGLSVNRLIRLAYGPFQLGGLPRDAVEEVPGKVLREQLGESGGPKDGGQKNAGQKNAGRKEGGRKEGGPRRRASVSRGAGAKTGERDANRRG
jgi:23S rRNA pseudouridine2605 synthase